MNIMQKLVIWWLKRRVNAAWAELEDLERTRLHYESSEVIARQDLHDAERRLARAEARIAGRALC